MITHDIDSLTNSAMMEIEKVMRKNGLAMNFHPHYVGNRALIRGMIAMMVLTPVETPDDAGREVPVLP